MKCYHVHINVHVRVHVRVCPEFCLASFFFFPLILFTLVLKVEHKGEWAGIYSFVLVMDWTGPLTKSVGNIWAKTCEHNLKVTGCTNVGVVVIWTLSCKWWCVRRKKPNLTFTAEVEFARQVERHWLIVVNCAKAISGHWQTMHMDLYNYFLQASVQKIILLLMYSHFYFLPLTLFRFPHLTLIPG